MRQYRPNLNNASYIGMDRKERRLNCRPVLLKDIHVNSCEVVFRNINHALIFKISSAEYVLVCCYSVSDFDFPNALVSAKGSSIITDAGQWIGIDEIRRKSCTEIIAEMQPCAYEWNAEGKAAFYKRLMINPVYNVEYEPLMHNKFIVFCGIDTYEDYIQFFEEEKSHLVGIARLIPKVV